MSAFLIYPGRAGVVPLDALLGTIPSLPRAALNRSVAHIFDRLDALNGETGFEDSDGNYCVAGDEGRGLPSLAIAESAPSHAANVDPRMRM